MDFYELRAATIIKASDIMRWCDFAQLILNCIQSHNRILGNNAEFPGGHIMRQERSYYAANYVIFLEKISHRTRTVMRFTTTLKISEALHDVSNAK